MARIVTIPDRLHLWRGAILATIAHAIWVTAHPLLSYELSWDGDNYSRQDSQGTRGTVTFGTDSVVAAFRDENSIRLPGRSGKQYDLNEFLRGIPEDLRSLAYNETLQYLLDEYEGRVTPIITAAFWGRDNTLTAAEPWIEVFEHGAHLISTEFMEPEVAILKWLDSYEMSDAQARLLQKLYTRKMERPDTAIILDKPEYAVLTSEGIDGIGESRELLAALGIGIPE